MNREEQRAEMKIETIVVPYEFRVLTSIAEKTLSGADAIAKAVGATHFLWNEKVYETSRGGEMTPTETTIVVREGRFVNDCDTSQSRSELKPLARVGRTG